MTAATSTTRGQTPVVVSVDAEEDNWRPVRTGITCHNVRRLPHLGEFLRRLGVRPTFFVTYQVAENRATGEMVAEAAHAAGGEIGAHLHPWNTPPQTEPLAPRYSMLNNLAADLQRRKLESLTAALERVFRRRPLAFRAGRYGLSRETVLALAACGYRVDASVTPYIDWRGYDDGPSFVGAPVSMYHLDGNEDVRVSVPGGPVIEVPVSAGYTRSPIECRSIVREFLDASAIRGLGAVASRLGVLRRLILNPELGSVGDLLGLSRALLRAGAGHLHVTWHSTSLWPGLTPFVPTARDVERFYAKIESYLEGLTALTSVSFVTVSQAAALASDD